MQREAQTTPQSLLLHGGMQHECSLCPRLSLKKEEGLVKFPI